MKEKKNNTSLIISALKKGDKHAFKSIYESNIEGLTTFVNSYTKNKSQTDDIVQETFIKLWNNRSTLDIKISISGFLYKTAYNNFIDKYRRKQRELNMLDSWMYKRLMEMTKDNLDTNEIKAKKIKHMLQAIEGLPPKCKEVFFLSKFEHLRYSEIAEKLKISIKTVEAQMGRAFSIIRKEVKDKDKDFLNFFLSFFKEKVL